MILLDDFKKITTFVFDVDGVLTDGTLFIFDNGLFIRRMHIKDGYALQLAVKAGYRVVVISGAESDPVMNRLNKLGVRDVFMNVRNKKTCLEEYISEHRLQWSEILFMGDDIPDYMVMKKVGIPCAPADAVAEIKQLSKYISLLNGGQGCVRDVIEKTLKLNGHWELDTSVPSR